MFQFQGIWFPDGEKHFPEWMANNGEIVDGRGTYQIKKFREAMKWVRQFRTAVDVGGHVGLWSMQIVKKFLIVEAFEPVSEFAACYAENLHLSASDDGAGDGIVNLHQVALGACRERGAFGAKEEHFAKMKIPPLGGGIDSGGTHIDPEEPDEFDTDVVPVRALDDFRLQSVDFIKIDCEGYEDQVIAGATETLERWKPCIIVEQKQHIMARNFGTSGTPAVDYLMAMGAKLRMVISGDYILSWDPET